MSYVDSEILTIDSPVGLDKIIQALQEELSSLPWMQKSFGRAWEFTEKMPDGRVVRVPKVWQGTEGTTGKGEYLNVLPNDHLTSQSFIMAAGAEEWIDFQLFQLTNLKQRKLKVIFWFNLNEIDANKDYIFTEELKADVEKLLKTFPYLKSIDSYTDEKAEDVFEGYINSGSGTLSTADDDLNQWCMHPYSGFRFNITVTYYEDC
jgi:hypothetical protein